MAKSPKKSKNGNHVWDRYGDDCAFILRNISTKDGLFTDWRGFLETPLYKSVLKEKYVPANLKRNFEKTLRRYDEFCSTGGGDITSELKEKAGLSTPKNNDDRHSGFDISPGSDDELTTDEAEEAELEELQGNIGNESNSGGETNKSDSKPEASDLPAQAPKDLYQVGLNYIEEKFDNVVRLDLHEDANKDTKEMKGCFVQHDIPDPTDKTLLRQRVCCFAILASGMDANKVEVTRLPNSNQLAFNGPLAKKISNSKTLLGSIGRRDKTIAPAFQAWIDDVLRKQKAGAGSTGEYTGIPWNTMVTMPTGLDLEADFVDPATNKSTRDPVFVNRISSEDCEIQSDCFFVSCFILTRKAHQGGAPARGDRDRLARLRAESFDSASSDTESSPDHGGGRRHRSTSRQRSSSSRRRSSSGRHHARSARRSNGRVTGATRNSRSVSARRRTSSRASGSRRHLDYEDPHYESEDVRSMDWEAPDRATSYRTPPRGSRMLTRRPSHTGSAGRGSVTRSSSRRNSERSSSNHSRHSNDIFHDADQAPGSGSKRTRSDQPTSPRRRIQLNDGTVIEESEEIQQSFEDDDVSYDGPNLETVSASSDGEGSSFEDYPE